MRTVDHVRTNAHTTDEITDLEKRNRTLAERAAEEGMVLLKNDGTLPLKKGSRVALFGRGATHTVKGGSGSGEVNGRKATSVYRGMKNEGFVISTEEKLADYVARVRLNYRDYVRERQQKAGLFNFTVSMAAMEHPYFPPAFPRLTKEDLTDPDETCVYVISRISGEGYDRKNEPGDFKLSEEEQSNLKLCAGHYRSLILVINVGGMIDLTPLEEIPVSAVIYMSMAGCEGGTALARILNGEAVPSGHLTQTWPKRYEDIPFAENYAYLNGNTKDEYYDEGIYVGYRYFDTWKKDVRYPFGYGLSYTTFEPEYTVSLEHNICRVRAVVKNTGDRAGKCVLQIYASAPTGELDKEYQHLAAFAKTTAIEPGEKAETETEFSLRELASFDPMTAEWILEPGTYTIRAGEDSRHTKVIAHLSLDQKIVLTRLQHICLQLDHLDELHGSEEETDPVCSAGNGTDSDRDKSVNVPELSLDASLTHAARIHYEEPGIPENADPKVLEWLDKLSASDLAEIVVGAGNDMVFGHSHYYTVPGAAGYTTARYTRLGITDLSFADGPAGIRVQQKSVAVRGKNRVRALTPSIEMMKYFPAAIKRMIFGRDEDGTVLYQYPTAWPVGCALAQTWNRELVEEVGRGICAELGEYGITFWLGPGVNIMRNPLCGRNYEYYSEDPYLSGMIAAAMIKGVQSDGKHYAVVKHFLCNSQETNRQFMDANVSERAIREIYLPAFEYAVKEGHVKALMTSYNMVNGVYSDMNRDTLIRVLRDEWKFDGIVMTDWDGMGRARDAARSIETGVDLLMSGNPMQKHVIRKALKDGSLNPKYIERSAAHVLQAVAEQEDGPGQNVKKI